MANGMVASERVRWQATTVYSHVVAPHVAAPSQVASFRADAAALKLACSPCSLKCYKHVFGTLDPYISVDPSSLILTLDSCTRCSQLYHTGRVSKRDPGFLAR